MQKTLEFALGNNQWSQTQVTVQTSRNGNYFVKAGDHVLVFSDPKTGTPVLCNINGKWATVGRMSPFTIFIGGPDQLSRFEWEHTLEGKAKIEAGFEAFRIDMAQFRASLKAEPVLRGEHA